MCGVHSQVREYTCIKVHLHIRAHSLSPLFPTLLFEAGSQLSPKLAGTAIPLHESPF